jgi:hypothetical protein
MRNRLMLCVTAVMLTTMAGAIRAADVHGGDVDARLGTVQVAHGEADGQHPAVPAQTTWAGVMVIIVVGLFVAAGAVGVVVRANAPDETPEADSHHDDSHDHGHDGGHH